MFERMFNFCIDLPNQLIPAINWLLGSQTILGGYSPLEILLWGGILFIIGLHVTHLVNPVG